ncbi:uncharacterized protein KNAG_0A05940 [Huiozyma naganishii CBS 8797]|uniref:GATA-type domain-containing protein n=1 Tax=Huiozyma naganishii (strain ATCC MYA-139 / BCRC 22969 / CBS 8797 / KCTC 17520 / NBRC 10181 / NCYC 3082 / Yp74L-3) TaxID=1071383 RepID=J7S3X8_HUIN7|nr:hypothetical protein KNAG_0A05940 [Kazachstania naganishii CBS 8797]CCK68256.1 hypothetical protein KNAG_0A05940 [Kazachstania naganishii CBS 8797]
MIARKHPKNWSNKVVNEMSPAKRSKNKPKRKDTTKIDANVKEPEKQNINLPSISNIIIESSASPTLGGHTGGLKNDAKPKAAREQAPPDMLAPPVTFVPSGLPNNYIGTNFQHRRGSSLDSFSPGRVYQRPLTNTANINAKEREMRQLQIIRERLLHEITSLESIAFGPQSQHTGRTDSSAVLSALQNLTGALHENVAQMIQLERDAGMGDREIYQAGQRYTVLPPLGTRPYNQDDGFSNSSSYTFPPQNAPAGMNIPPALNVQSTPQNVLRGPPITPDLNYQPGMSSPTGHFTGSIRQGPVPYTPYYQIPQPPTNHPPQYLTYYQPKPQHNLPLQRQVESHVELQSPKPKKEPSHVRRHSSVDRSSLTKTGSSLKFFPQGSIAETNPQHTFVLAPLHRSTRTIDLPPRTPFRETLTGEEIADRSFKTVDTKHKKTKSTSSAEVTDTLRIIPTLNGKNLITKGSVSHGGSASGTTQTLRLSNKVLQEKAGKRTKSQETPKALSRQEDSSEEVESDGEKRCFHCNSSKTPEWRAGPYGNENICNACGLFYRKVITKFGVRGGNLLMKYRQHTAPTNRRVPPYIEIPEEFMIQFHKEEEEAQKRLPRKDSLI